MGQHARPSRLKHGALVGAEGGEQTKAPVWDDTGAEQEYLNTPHFRSFMKLFGVQEQLSLVVSATNQLMRRQEAHAHEQRAVMEESAHLRHDIQVLDDDEGHARRLDEARTAAAEANEMVRICGIDSAEVVAQLQMETLNWRRPRKWQTWRLRCSCASARNLTVKCPNSKQKFVETCTLGELSDLDQQLDVQELS